jgi:hypothetical protein
MFMTCGPVLQRHPASLARKEEKKGLFLTDSSCSRAAIATIPRIIRVREKAAGILADAGA